jgi:hypothetical protein
LFQVEWNEMLTKLKDLFADLSRAEADHAQYICGLEWIWCESPIRSIILRRLSDRVAEPSATLRVASRKEGVDIEWSRHREGWLECAEKIDALRMPGHQYLTREVDDAVVEVSFMENLRRIEA